MFSVGCVPKRSKDEVNCSRRGIGKFKGHNLY
jgi:hypothetical protein